METIRLSLFLIMCLVVHMSSSEILKRQKRNWIIDSFSIDEGYEGSFPYPLGKIEIEKNFTFFRIHGQGVDEEPKGILQIDENTGEITVHGPVDYERNRVLKLTFQALDRGRFVVDTQLGIEILIVDANDNPPKFSHDKYEITIKESTIQGTELITIQANDDDSNENNRLFDFKKISVTPEPSDLDFYLTQSNQAAHISFKGCLSYEKANTYTIIVMAKDRGEKIQLSSSCTIIIKIEDGNNNLPVITGQTGTGRVKEGQENVLVKRLQVTDKDSKGTAAWRAKYQIQGDANNNFRITTDPETNEGLLYVEKHLNYEDSPQKNLTISVENELPYHSCKVASRSTGLWKVITAGATVGTGTQTPGLSTNQVTVNVEDVNDAPVFDISNQHVTVGENAKTGLYLATFTARDPDVTSGNTIVYRKGEDPADWVTVDPKTGKITTSKIIDRESTFVTDNIYNVTIYAADNGHPPMTGTATLNIHITDENDNTPYLAVSTFDMCQSDGPSLANITALDLDEEPYGGPFSFKLQEKEKGKWKLDPTQGYSVNLVKDHKVISGEYELLLEVFDLQGERSAFNLSVTVCNCIDPKKPSCRIRRAAGSTVGEGALGIIFLCMLLLAGVLLLTFWLSCKEEKKETIQDDGSGYLMKSNTEEPGTDCKVSFEQYSQNDKQFKITSQDQAMKKSKQEQRDYLLRLMSDSTMDQNFKRGNYMRQSWGGSSTRNYHRSSMRATSTRHRRYSADQESGVMQRTMVLKVLKKKMITLNALGEELGDYNPHVYAEEGDTKTNCELDAISIPDLSFDPALDLDLDYRFSTLASICMPNESTAYSTSNSKT